MPYLAESPPPDDFEGLEVVQAEPRPLQAQELGLLAGVLRAPHDFLRGAEAHKLLFLS